MHDDFEARLTEVCCTAFGRGARVFALHELSPGAENHVYAFDAELRAELGARRPLILKLYSGGAEVAHHEARLCRKVRERGFPAPEVLHVDEDTQAFGLPFCLMRRIDGQTLGAVMAAAGPEASARWLQRFAELAGRLHCLSVEGLVDVAGDADACLDQELARYDRALTELEVPEFRPVYDWLLARRRQLRARGPALIHQDYHPLNVMVDRNENLYLLDWSLARATDPRSDLAQTFQMLRSAGFGRLRPPITAAYEAATRTTLDAMDFFDVFAALKNVAGQYAVLDAGAEKRPKLWARLSSRPSWEARAVQLAASVPALAATYRTITELSGVRVPAAEALFAPPGS